jgi:hypothetical protein
VQEREVQQNKTEIRTKEEKKVSIKRIEEPRKRRTATKRDKESMQKKRDVKEIKTI